jgi:hypothetical protein
MMHAMCMLAVFFRTIDDCPVLVAANREEYYDRQGTEPQLWDGEPSFVAGRDPRAGGTWLGVNQHGVLIAITNRPKLRQPPQPRSRGLLCRDLLSSRTARAAHERALDEMDRDVYAGCNLLAIDAAGAYVVQAGEFLRSSPLPPGIHIVTAGGLNDTADERTEYAFDQLASPGPRTANEWLGKVHRLCGDHGDSTHPPICLHAAGRGTVSSSIIAIPEDLRQARWLHAQGPPCSVAFNDFSSVLIELLGPQKLAREAY